MNPINKIDYFVPSISKFDMSLDSRVVKLDSRMTFIANRHWNTMGSFFCPIVRFGDGKDIWDWSFSPDTGAAKNAATKTTMMSPICHPPKFDLTLFVGASSHRCIVDPSLQRSSLYSLSGCWFAVNPN
jgi:hypothetical protein